MIFMDEARIYVDLNERVEEGNPDNLFADAVAIKADPRICSVWSYVKWWCRIDMSTLIHESERRARNR
jgi:hypothetical protein